MYSLIWVQTVGKSYQQTTKEGLKTTKEVMENYNTKMTVNCLVSDNMECLLTVDLYAPIVVGLKTYIICLFCYYIFFSPRYYDAQSHLLLCCLHATKSGFLPLVSLICQPSVLFIGPYICIGK